MGSRLGEFSESEFQAKLFANELTSADYCWHEGMVDAKPISDYRVLAKTQRFLFAPPMRSTIKIDIEPATTTQNVPPPNPISRFLHRPKNKSNPDFVARS